MLEIRVVRIECLLHLDVDQRGLTCLSSFLLSLGYLSDAFIDHSCGCCPHLHSLVLECLEDTSVVLFLPEKFIECDYRLFPAKLPQNEDC